jgi:hypothetical protein
MLGRIVFLALTLSVSFISSALAMAPLADGVYKLQVIKESWAAAKPTPNGCLVTMTIQSGSDALIATFKDQTPECQTSASTTHIGQRVYHLVAGMPFLCGLGYKSTESQTGGVVMIGGGGAPSVLLNDYRPAPAQCTAPTNGMPPVPQVIHIQEFNGGQMLNMQSVQ